MHRTHLLRRKDSRTPWRRVQQNPISLKGMHVHLLAITQLENWKSKRVLNFKTRMVHLWNSHSYIMRLNSSGHCPKMRTRAHFFFLPLLSLVCKCKNGRKGEGGYRYNLTGRSIERGSCLVLFKRGFSSSMYNMYTTVARFCIRKPGRYKKKERKTAQTHGIASRKP